MKKKLFHLYGVQWLLCVMVLSLFTTCAEDEGPLNRIPKLSINDIASGISSSQATLEGVISDNGSPITRCGFMVNTAKGVLEKTGIDEASVHEVTLTASGNVRLQLKDLKASTTYYYCLFVVSGNTPIKSSIGHFTTEDIAEPRFSTVEVVEVGEDFVTLRCRLIDNGGQALQTVGFDYKLQEAQSFRSVTVEDFEEGTADNSFVYTITELEPGTYYDFRASGFNGVRTGYSEIRSAQTSAKTSPTVSILDLVKENIGVNYVTVAAKIEDTGAAEITERGFLIGLVSNPVIGTEGVVNVSVFTATNDFSATLENLKPNTTYYVRAYAANNPYGSKTQYGYSPSLAFTTKSWETPTFSSITEQLEGIRLKVSCTLDNKGISIQERGFCYSSSNTTPDLTHQSVKVESEGSAIMEASFQILENTVYYIRPYVKYNLTGQEQVHYGTTYTSQRYTFVRPTFNEVVSGEVTYTTAQLSASINDNGVSVTKRGFKWGTNSVPANNVVVSGSDFKASLTGLTPGTTYYYQAYVEFELAGKSEQVVSTVQSFKTTAVEQPVLGDLTYSQQQNVLSLSSTFSKHKDVEVTESGFCWSQSVATPDVDGTVATGSTVGDKITATLTVSENTSYYIRPYVKYRLATVTGVVYGKTVTVKTNAYARPSFKEVTSGNITYTSSQLHALLEVNGVTIKKRGFKWGVNAVPTSDLVVSESEFQASLTGLTPGTTYYYQAYVEYELAGKKETLSSEIVSFKTTAVEQPILGDVTYSQQQNVLSLSSTFSKHKDVEVTESGFCWSQSVATPDVDGTVATGSTVGDKITATLTVSENTSYYIRPYVKYRLATVTGVVYGKTVTVKTNAYARPSFKEVTSSNITYTSSQLHALLEVNGVTIKKRGFKWGVNAVPTSDLVVSESEFQASLTGLTPGTTYYYQAYVEYELAGKKESLSSEVVSFKTQAVVKPILGVVNAKQQQTKLTLTSSLQSHTDVSITEVGFCWSQSSVDPDIYSNTIWGTQVQNDIVATFTIEENATYYIRSYVKYTAAGISGIAYSEVLIYEASALTRPSFTSVTSSDITYMTATLRAVIVTKGATITRRYFKWGTTPNPLTELPISGSEFKATLDKLSPTTKYYYRACIEFKIDDLEDTMESPVYSFDTQRIPEPVFGTVTSTQTVNTLSLSCPISSNGLTVNEVGYYYSTTNKNPGMTDKVVKGTFDGSKIMASISVGEDMTYYIRPYAKYSLVGVSDMAYGLSTEVKTNSFLRPTMGAVTVGDITYTTARLTASLNENGLTISKRGFKWGRSSVPTTDLPVEGTLFQASLEGLTLGTTYYCQAYAEYELAGQTQTITSEVTSFTTRAVVKPTLGTLVTKQQQSKLSLSSELTASEDVKVVESGFCWSRTTTEPDLNSQVVAATISDRQLTATMTVEENVTYYIRSYVKYEVAGVNGTAFSAVQTLKTKAFTRPTLSQVSSSGVTYNAATLSAMLTTNGVHIVSKGFKWGLNSSVSNNVPVSGSEFMLSLSELTPASRYFFKAYVIYTIDDVQHTLESDLFTFETQGSPEPVLGTLNTSLQGSQLSLSCLLNANNADITEVGFCWSKGYTQPTISNNTLTGSLSGSYFVASMSLDEQTTYYLRAYAKYQALGLTQVVYSEVKSIKSDALARPSITNVAVGEITYNAAKLSASIAANGATILSKGFKLGISASNMTSQVVTSDEFVHLFSDLLANTTYYYQAYVTYKVGGKEETISTTQKYFTTKSLVGSTINKPSVSNIGNREATVSAVITALGDGEVKQKGFVWSSSTSSPTLSNKTGSVELAADADFKAQLTGLSDGTNYYVRAYVINEGSGESVTSYSSYTSFTTAQLTYPTLNKPTASEITQTTIKVTSSLQSSGNSEVTEMGFCWSDQDIAPEKMTNRSKVTANNFTLTVTDTVKAGNTYYIYSYATNKKGTAYSTKLKATLKYIPGQGDNPHPGNE